MRLKGFEPYLFTYPVGQTGFAAFTVFTFLPRAHRMLTTFAGAFPVLGVGVAGWALAGEGVCAVDVSENVVTAGIAFCLVDSELAEVCERSTLKIGKSGLEPLKI